MKPRLESAPLTDEDLAIMVAFRSDPGHAYFRGTLFGRDGQADRRDADLMLKFALQRPTNNHAAMLFWATYGLPYADTNAIVAEWMV